MDNPKRISRSFALQFRPDGDGFLYRQDTSGPAIRITAAEHRRYISTFNRRALFSQILFMGGFFVGSLFLVWRSLGQDEGAWILPFLGLILGGGGLFGAAFIWAWYAPSRDLKRRRPAGDAGPARPVPGVLQDTPFALIAALAVAGPALCWRLTGFRDLADGWNPLWVALGLAPPILSAIIAVRKWRASRRKL